MQGDRRRQCAYPFNANPAAAGVRAFAFAPPELLPCNAKCCAKRPEPAVYTANTISDDQYQSVTLFTNLEWLLLQNL
jgi:hypothetical protein